MTRDNIHSDREPSRPSMGDLARPPMGDLGPATETLAQVLAQLREITRETHTSEALPDDNYRPLEPRSLKQSRKPIRLHSPAKKRRWPIRVATGASLLVLAGALALPLSGLFSDRDAGTPSNTLQQFASKDKQANPSQPEITKAVAQTPAPVATTQTVEAVSLPLPLRREVAAIQPEPVSLEQSAPVSTSSIRQQVVRIESDVALPPIDPPDTLAMTDLIPPAPPESPKIDAPAAPVREQLTDTPAPAPIVPTPGMRVASLGEITIRPAAPPPSQPSVATGLIARAQELIRNRDISSARLVLEKALSTGSPEAAFQLAETYDPQVLSAWQVRGITGDAARARQLYAKASESGVKIAEERLRALH